MSSGESPSGDLKPARTVPPSTPETRKIRSPRWPPGVDPFDHELPGRVTFPSRTAGADVRPLGPADWEDVLGLVAEVWGRAQAETLDRVWPWLSRENPHAPDEPALAVGLRQSGQLAAFAVIVPLLHRIEGRLWRTYLLSRVTAPARRQGAGFRLLNALRSSYPVITIGNAWGAAPMMLRWFREYRISSADQNGFPPEPHARAARHPTVRAFLSWPMPATLVRPATIAGRRPALGRAADPILRFADRFWLRTTGVEVSRPRDVPPDLNPFLAAATAPLRFVLHRTVDQLRWRYLENPERDYHMIVARAGGEVVGYCVYEETEGSGGEPVWSVADWLVKAGDQLATRGMWAGVVRLARQEGIGSVRVTRPLDPLLARTMTRLGFLARYQEESRHDVWRWPADLSPGAALGRGGWWIQPGDFLRDVI